MTPIQSVLITGANAGLGREAARQLAQQKGIEKIILACRSADKAQAAKSALEAETGRKIFDIVLIDMMNPATIRNAVSEMTTPVDAVILNAGGTGGRTPYALTDDGVTHVFATNVLGHVVLVNEMLERQLITSSVLYAGSEAARGIPKMGIPRPELASEEPKEFTSIADGSKFGPEGDPLVVYANIKLTAALWMSAMARQHPHVRFVTMSPGGTTGTNGFDDLSFVKRLFFKHIGGVLMPLFGMMHGLETGAKRYVDGLLNPKYESGHFYASRAGSPTGTIVDQTTVDARLGEPALQESAHRAIAAFA